MFHLLANVRREERATVLFAFAGLCLLIAAHAILETARDALFLTSLPASRLPWAYLGIALGAVLVLQLQARVPIGQDNRKIFAAFMVISAGIAVVFWELVDDSHPWTFGALYIWTGIYSTICMTRFWMLVQDLFTVTQAKRVFAVIGAGGVAGAILGSATARGLVTVVAPPELLLAASALALASGVVIAIGLRDARPVESAGISEAGHAPDWVECAALIRERPYLRRLFRLMILSAASLTLVDYIFKSVVAGFVPADRLAEFFSTAYLALNLLSLLVQVGLVGRLMRTLSVDQVLGLTPFLVTVGTLAVMMFYTLWPLLLVFPVMGLKVVDGSLRYSLHRTTLETLFVPLARELRDRVKTFIDVLGQRGGQAIASLLILGATLLPGWQMVIASMLLGLGWGWIRTALEIRRDYLDIFRTTLSRSRPDPTIEFPELDLSSLESLISRLNSTNDREVLAAMDLLAVKGKVRLIPQLILYHPSDRVVTKALAMFSADGYVEITDILDRLSQHESGPVRAAALRARSRLAPDVNRQLNEFLDDPSPVVRATALATLVASDWIGGADAEKALRAIADTAEPDELQALLIAIAEQPHPVYCSLLLHLSEIEDLEPEVAKLLAQAMGHSPDPVFIDALIRMIPRRAVRDTARLALLEHGDDALARLDEWLGDPSTPQNIRRHLPRTIHRFEPDEAAKILMRRMLEMDDGLVRFKILRALGGLRSREPELKLDNARLRRGIERTLAGALRVIDWRSHLERSGETDPARKTVAHDVLVHAMLHKERRATERLFRILGLLYPEENFQRIHAGFDSANPRERASSFELIENILPAPLNVAILAYMDQISDHQRVLRGAAYYTSRDWTYEEILSAFIREGSVGLRCITYYQVAELRLDGLSELIEGRRKGAHSLEAPIIERTLEVLAEGRTA
jgi:ATP/ADP translocase